MLKETPAFFSLTQGNNHRQERNVDSVEPGECPGVTEPVSQCVLKIVGGCRDQNSQLISKTWESTSHSVRGHFIQVGWDDSPRSLHTNLDQKRTHHECGQGSSESPNRNYGQ